MSTSPEFSNADLRVIARLACEEAERQDPILVVDPSERDIARAKLKDAQRLERKVRLVRKARKPPPEPPY